MANMDEVYRAFLKADAAGDKASAQVLADYIRQEAGIVPEVEQTPERTIGGYAKEALKGLIPGAAGLAETAITGAAALLPEEAEQAVRRGVSGVVEPIREAFAPAPGYEDTAVRKLSEAVGSTLPFLPLGALGAAGRAAAVGLGVGAGAGESRLRAEEEGTTEEERGLATALGTVPGALEAYAPIQILRRLGFGDEAVKEVAGFVPALRRAAQAGGEEGLMEASSQVLQNLIAKGIYAPNEAVLGGVGEAAALGGGAGAIVSAIADLALGRRLRGRGEEEPSAEEPETPPEQLPPSETATAVPPETIRAIAPPELTPEERRDELERRARELRFIAQSDDRLRQAIERQEADEASKDDLDYLAQYDAVLQERDAARRRPLGDEDQMGLPLEGGFAQMDLLAPTEPGQPVPGMYRPAEEALQDLRPRSRAYKEEAKDLGLKLDRKGNLKPNQFVPEITSQVSPDQERFEFESQQELPLTMPAPLKGQGDLFAEGVPIPPREMPKTPPATVETPAAQEIPKEQFALDLPGIPMERLTPRDRVLRAMAITEDKKNIPNLRFATQLRPMELQKTIGDLKNEGAIAFNKKANEWELTPAGVENVRTGSEVKTPRRRRGFGVPVPPQGTAGPDVTETGESGVGGVGAPPERVDVGEGPSVSALETTAPEPIAAAPEPTATPAAPTPPVDRMALIRRAAEKQVARTAIDETTQRRTALRTRAIEAFDADEINENTYTTVTDELKKPVPNFARVTSLLEGTAKPKREKDIGIDYRKVKFQQGETGRGVAPERIRAVADETMRGWTNPPEVVVVDKIPEEYKAELGKTLGAYKNGRMFVFAENAREDRLRGTILHESLGHYGLEQEFKEGLAAEMSAIYKGNAKVRDAVTKLRTIKEYSALNDVDATEEVLAKLSEQGPIKETGLASAVYKAISWVRNWLRKKGFIEKYTDNDIVQVLQQAHRRVTELKKAPYDPFNPQIRYQRSPAEQQKGDRAFLSSITSIPAKLPKPTSGTFQAAADAASNATPAMRRALYSTLTAHDFDRMYGKHTKGFGQLWSEINSEGAFLRKQEDLIMENYQKWEKILSKYSPAERDRIFDTFMATTTTKVQRTTKKGKVVEQFGVEVLDLKDDKRRINWVADKSHPLYQQYQALVRKDPKLEEVYKGLRLAYLDYSLGIEEVLKQYLAPTEWQKLISQFNEKRLPVYFPLFRKGDFKLKYVDKNGDTVSLQFETLRERNRVEMEVRRSGVRSEDIITSRVGTPEADAVPPSGFFGTIVGKLTEQKVNPEVITSIVNTYLDLLPAQSTLQFARQRKATAGYSKDMLDAYANVGSSYARRLTNLTYTPKFRAAQQKIKEDLENARTSGALDTNVVDDLLDTTKKQMEFIRDPKLNSLAAKLSYFSFQMYLGANISTAIVNLVDIPTITYSRLAGKHGWGKAFNAIQNASTAYFSKKKSKEMEEVLQRGLDSGVLREQQLRDIAEFKNVGSKYDRIKAGVERASSWAFAKSDMFNRNVAFMAAYQLNKSTPENVFDEKAFDAAQRAVYDVYGSSFPKASPPIMGNGFARTALTFKKFALIRINLLLNAYREATKGETPEVREAARREILAYFGTAYLFAGVQGMPVVGALSLLASVLNGALGDDDEPYNPDFELRDAIGLFNYKGPANYLLGVDFASRTGWTGMLWREDPKRMAEVGPVTYAMEQFLGPAYSYANGIFKPNGVIDNFSEGQYQRGFEQFSPKVVGNILKGMRYLEEGAITPSGKPLVDDVDAYNVFMQILGFRPSDVAEAGETAGAITRMQRQILERRNAIIARASVARLSGDYEGFQEAIEEAQSFSAKFPERAITAKTLVGAVQRRQKALAQSVYGISVDQKLARRISEELGLEE